MLKLKLQHFGHLMQRIDSLEKPLMLAKIEGRRRRGWQRMRWLDGITKSMERVWASSGTWWWTGNNCSPWGLKEPDMTERLNCTEKLVSEKLKAGIPWAVQWLGLSHWVWSWPLSHMLSLGLILGLETKIPTSHVAKNKWIFSKKEIWQSLECRLEGKGEAGEEARAKSRTQVGRWNSLSSWKWRGSSNQPSEQGKRSDTNQQLGSEPNRQYKEQGSPNRSEQEGAQGQVLEMCRGLRKPCQVRTDAAHHFLDSNDNQVQRKPQVGASTSIPEGREEHFLAQRTGSPYLFSTEAHPLSSKPFTQAGWQWELTAVFATGYHACLHPFSAEIVQHWDGKMWAQKRGKEGSLGNQKFG